MSPLRVFLSFLKLGIISFGGGAALIPVIGEELVEKKKWMDKEKFNYSVAVVAASPGSQPVALCSIWSKKYALLSAYAYALPGPVLFLILSTSFSIIGDAGVRYVNFASVGIIAFILMILCLFIKKCYLHGTKSVPKWQYLLLIATAFFLTNGAIVRNLTLTLGSQLNGESLPNPIFALNMINLLIMAFFVIFFIGKSNCKFKISIAIFLAVMYALSVGRMGLLGEWSFAISVLMLILACASIFYDVFYKKKNGINYKINYDPLKNILIALSLSFALTAVVYFVSGESRTWEFVFRVILSALSSFGGGEAYIAVADTFFVQTGFTSAEVYYSQIVGISSAMPGPVLMSIAGGIGFAFGNGIGGVLFGWVFGLLAIISAVTATSLGALFLLTCFETFKDSHRLHMIILYIIPLVCGMLISIALSLLNQSSSVLIREGVDPWLAVGIMLALFLLMMILRIKYKLNDIKLLLLGGVGSLAVLSFIF